MSLKQKRRGLKKVLEEDERRDTRKVEKKASKKVELKASKKAKLQEVLNRRSS